MTHSSEDMARLSETHNDLGPDQTDDEADTGMNFLLKRMQNYYFQCKPRLNFKHTIQQTLKCSLSFSFILCLLLV